MSSALGDQEQEVLRTVSRIGPCTVRDVFTLIGAPHGLAYTTIATVLDRLHTKGLVSRQLEGKAFIYKTTRRSAAAEKGRARTLVSRVLGRGPAPAVATLVDAVESIDPALLDRLAEEVERRRTRRGS